MNKLHISFLAFCITLLSCTSFSEKAIIKLKTKSLEVSIDETGSITGFFDKSGKTNFISKDTASPLMSIKIDDEILLPIKAIASEDNIILTYENGIIATVNIEEKETHLVFELVSISNNTNIELIVWGPYTTIINKIIGETVGVVRSDHYAIGIQSLNPKTLGGYPWKSNDCMPQIDVFDQDDPSDMSEKGKRYVLYRVEAAKPTIYGSSLQAYCRNRNEDRILENWGHEYYVAPSFDDGGILGSKIALFGCKADEALLTIGSIELSENLPHPLINGSWGKTSSQASAAYMIFSFGEDDIQKAIDLTKKAGLGYLYHPGPFETWGHFKLNDKQFPNGIEGLKNCVDIANSQGITIGLHTLSNFISTNDAYVTPVPDDRLAKVGSSNITEEITIFQTEIPIQSPTFFNQYKNNHLKTVIINNELIRYGEVSSEEPWKLINCVRGAFNTIASKHSINSEISKLADHGYKVFLTNSELSMEVAETISNIFNKTGLRQISFDGLEGCRSTGMGNYGEVLFTTSWYNKLDENIKSHFIADASRTSHYFWHIYTRMNWGEPWYGGFRESQTEYRLKNQKYFKRNLMPGMLGWFKMTSETSIEDAEWLLARSAAFDAGYALVTSSEAIENNGDYDRIMSLIGDWEKVRIQGVFSDDQKLRMEDINNEFTLRNVRENEWVLTQVSSNKFKHEKKTLQPGEPLYTTFNFNNNGKEQVLNFIITAVDGEVSNIKIEIDNYNEIILPITLKKGQSIKYFGKEKAYIYNGNWQLISEFKINSSVFIITPGNHSISFDCNFANLGDEPLAKLELRTLGESEKLSLLTINK